ncbi:hypothetical protein [Curtobacterium sp. MCLR17_054]|uniref:hypothetical protein n=1 Tax=Curtobacterium sp. MCLR17_054 TaxID=2175632 RepID=UPI0011B38637|nr:hypothetical protein [Curtobacterium sp. MCLR17_054]WIE70317.1 hypothetical protein DEJ08_018265 [Curtobacterium sp. MCLR17_054]
MLRPDLLVPGREVHGNPSAFVLGLVGLGKSTIIRRWIIALAPAGVIPLVLGDTKPDHVGAIEAIGGEVITVGPGRAGTS